MDETRRTFLRTAMTAAGAAATPQPVATIGQRQDQNHQTVPPDLALRVKSLESLLVDKGLVDRAALDAVIDTMEHKVGPQNGARVIARAWVDPAYKQRLLDNAPAAIAELGYTSGQGEHMVVVENTADVLNARLAGIHRAQPTSPDEQSETNPASPRTQMNCPGTPGKPSQNHGELSP
jgi:hypothetical protein